MPEAPSADADAGFEKAFERHWLPVFRFAVAWTNDWRSAEDLAQDAFVRLWIHRSRLDWSEPMLPWLLTTTRHLATDRFRRLRRTIQLGTPAVSPTLDTDARLRWLDVREALAFLTPLQRSALILTAVVGLDTDTVAAALETTPGGVRAAVSRARVSLRQADAESA